MEFPTHPPCEKWPCKISAGLLSKLRPAFGLLCPAVRRPGGGGGPVLRPFCSWPSFMLSIFVLLKSIIRPDFGPCNFIAPAIELPIEIGDSYGGAVAQYLLPAEDPVAEWQRGKMEEDAHDQAFNRLPVLIKNAAIDTKKFFMGNYDPAIFVHLFVNNLDDITIYCREFISRGISQVVAVHGNSQESLSSRRVYSWNSGLAECLGPRRAYVAVPWPRLLYGSCS